MGISVKYRVLASCLVALCSTGCSDGPGESADSGTDTSDAGDGIEIEG
ncbi:MAG: hypothetical protein JRG91_18545, partial [Deltaproteobacteria bacterium]|nr:hypothetical protein [Deltaproteobacteria bacterium]